MKPIDWTKPIQPVFPTKGARYLGEIKDGHEIMHHICAVEFVTSPKEYVVYMDSYGRGLNTGLPVVENVPPPPPHVIGRWAQWWEHDKGVKGPSLHLYTTEAAMNSDKAQRSQRHKAIGEPFFIKLETEDDSYLANGMGIPG